MTQRIQNGRYDDLFSSFLFFVIIIFFFIKVVVVHLKLKNEKKYTFAVYRWNLVTRSKWWQNSTVAWSISVKYCEMSSSDLTLYFRFLSVFVIRSLLLLLLQQLTFFFSLFSCVEFNEKSFKREREQKQQSSNIN